MLVYSNRQTDRIPTDVLSLLSRYIFREALGTTVIVMAVLLVILMSNQFAEILGEAAADNLPREAVLRVFGLTFLRFMTLLAPISLLLGVLLALARLNRDSEMAALAACGIGTFALLRPIGVLSVLASAGVAWLALFQAPAASREIEAIKFDAREAMELATLTPGSFTTTERDGTVLYVRDAEGERLHGVFMQSERDERVVVVVAEEGERVQNPATGELSLKLRNGRRYEGVPGEAEFFIAEFEENWIPIEVERQEFVEAIEAKPTRALIESGTSEDRAELEWRAAAPLSTLLLVLLAVPLSRSSPREGRYARVGVGLLLYITYSNTLSIARVWVERGIVPEWIGTWWVHALLGLLALGLLLRESGALARRRPYRYPVRERREPTA